MPFALIDRSHSQPKHPDVVFAAAKGGVSPNGQAQDASQATALKRPSALILSALVK